MSKGGAFKNVAQYFSERRLVLQTVVLFNHLANVQLVNAGLSGSFAFARLPRPADASKRLAPRAVGMVHAYPADTKAVGALLIHLHIVRRKWGWRGRLLFQFLFGLIPKFLIPAFRLADLLPQLVGAEHDFV